MNKLEYKNYLLCYISKEELVDRICNAIEYIKNHEVIENNLYEQSKAELLEILGNKENEKQYKSTAVDVNVFNNYNEDYQDWLWKD